VLSHPSRKNKIAARVGYPDIPQTMKMVKVVKVAGGNSHSLDLLLLVLFIHGLSIDIDGER
jgi:hypothetical protein